MAHQAPLLSKFFMLLAFISGCNLPGQKDNIHNELLNKNDTSLKINNGVLIKTNEPFNGKLFTLNEGTIDTLELSSYKAGREDGEWKKFYPGKIIKEIRYFKDGRKTGKYLAWWPNGQKQLEYNFAADEYEGICKEWNEAGLLNKIMNYKNGYEEGHQQWFYDNGKVKANYIIKDNRRFGLLGTKNCINVSDSIFKK